MAIVSIGSYESTTLEFYDNWGTANTELAPSLITLIGNYDRSDFFADRTILLASIDDANTKRRAARAKNNARDALRIALSTRATQFRLAVLSQIGDALIIKRVPNAPRATLELSKFTAPLKAISELWQEINDNAQRLELAAPLSLQGGYTQAQFQLDVEQVQTLSDETDTAERSASTARGSRDLQLKAIYARMKQYRFAAQA